MGNTIPDRADRPDEALRPLPGDVIRASDWADLPGLANAAISEVGATVVISQEWPDGQASHAGAIPQEDSADVPLATWLIPVPSDRHASLHVEVRAWNSSGVHDGRITLRSRTTLDEISVVVGVGAAAGDSWTDVGALDIEAATIGDHEGDLIDLFIDSDDAAATVTLEQISAEIRDLASPLPAQAITTLDTVAGPMGADQLADDEPLSTPVAHDLIDVDAHLRPRPNLGLAWSGLNPAYDGPGADDRWMAPHGVLSAHRTDPSCRHAVYANAHDGGGIQPGVPLAQFVTGSLFDRLRVDDDDPTWMQAVGGADSAGNFLDEFVYRGAGYADIDHAVRVGVTPNRDVAFGFPNPVTDPDADPIYVAGLTVWTSHQTGVLPAPMSRESAWLARPVTGDQLARLQYQLLIHEMRRSPRQVHHQIDYARTATPIETDRPAPITRQTDVRWTTSRGATHAILWIRYQAADLSETDPSIDLTLWDLDADAEADSYTIAPALGLGYDPGIQQQPVPAWPMREWVGAGYPIELPEDGGVRVELRLACTNVRLVSASVLELPRDIDLGGV